MKKENKSNSGILQSKKNIVNKITKSRKTVKKRIVYKLDGKNGNGAD
jgi:hypothetical protein